MKLEKKERKAKRREGKNANRIKRMSENDGKKFIYVYELK
jgi:hypothetical protein